MSFLKSHSEWKNRWKISLSNFNKSYLYIFDFIEQIKLIKYLKHPLIDGCFFYKCLQKNYRILQNELSWMRFLLFGDEVMREHQRIEKMKISPSQFLRDKLCRVSLLTIYRYFVELILYNSNRFKIIKLNCIISVTFVNK